MCTGHGTPGRWVQLFISFLELAGEHGDDFEVAAADLASGRLCSEHRASAIQNDLLASAGRYFDAIHHARFCLGELSADLARREVIRPRR